MPTASSPQSNNFSFLKSDRREKFRETFILQLKHWTCCEVHHEVNRVSCGVPWMQLAFCSPCSDRTWQPETPELSSSTVQLNQLKKAQQLGHRGRGCSGSSRLPSQLSTGCTGACQKCCFRLEKISVPLLNQWCCPSREREIPASQQVSDQRGLPEGCFHCKTAVTKNTMRWKPICHGNFNLIWGWNRNCVDNY